jgi:hypothetical protein
MAKKYSRYPAMTRVLYPLIPPPPAGVTVVGNNYTFMLPPDNRDVFGILIQAFRTPINSGLVITSSGKDLRRFTLSGQDENGNYLEEIFTLGVNTHSHTVVKPFAWVLWLNVCFGTVLNEIPTPLPDGATNTFTVAKNMVPNTETIYVDGNPQIRNIDYTVTGNSFSFIDAVPLETGFGIQVSYDYEITTNLTVTISDGGTAIGTLLPTDLQWLANRILYRYEDVVLSMPVPLFGTINSLGSPILAPLTQDPGLTYTFAGGCELPFGSYVGPDPVRQDDVTTVVDNNTIFNAFAHGYRCPDFLYVYFYNLLDELSLPYVVKIKSAATDSISVRDFGAVGDGITNDTAAVQCALDKAHENWLDAQARLAGLPVVGSPPQTGPTIVILPSGMNCLVGFNNLASPNDTTLPNGLSPFVGGTNLGMFALYIRSGVTFQVDGQLTLNKPNWATISFGRYTQAMLVGYFVNDVQLCGQGVIELNGIPVTTPSSPGTAPVAAIWMLGYDIRIQDLTIKNSAWDSNPFRLVRPLGNSAGNGINVIELDLQQLNKQSVVSGLTIDGTGLAPPIYTTDFTGVQFPTAGAAVTQVPDSAIVISPPNSNVFSQYGFGTAILVKPEITAVKTHGSPLRAWSATSDVKSTTGLLIENNTIIQCLRGFSGEADALTIQDNRIVDAWSAIEINYGKHVTVKGNTITSDSPGSVTPTYPSGASTAINPPQKGITVGLGLFLPPAPGAGGVFNSFGNLNYVSNRLMGCRVYDNHVSGIRGVGIFIQVSHGNPDYVGTSNFSNYYMSDLEIFGNSSNYNTGLGFVLTHRLGSGNEQGNDTDYDTNPFQRINIHDNSASANKIEYVGVYPVHYGIYGNQAVDLFAPIQPGIFDWPLVPNYSGVASSGQVNPDYWTGGVNFPSWEMVPMGLVLDAVVGTFVAGPSYTALTGLVRNGPRGLSYANPSIRNEYMVNGALYRHWSYVENEAPTGLIDAVNRQFTLANAPAAAHPFASPITQYSFQTEYHFEMYINFTAPAVQDSPGGGTNFPSPRPIKVMSYLEQSQHFGDLFHNHGAQILYAVKKDQLIFAVGNLINLAPGGFGNPQVTQDLGGGGFPASIGGAAHDNTTHGLVNFKVIYRYIPDQGPVYMDNGLFN